MGAYWVCVPRLSRATKLNVCVCVACLCVNGGLQKVHGKCKLSFNSIFPTNCLKSPCLREGLSENLAYKTIKTTNFHNRLCAIRKYRAASVAQPRGWSLGTRKASGAAPSLGPKVLWGEGHRCEPQSSKATAGI